MLGQPIEDTKSRGLTLVMDNSQLDRYNEHEREQSAEAAQTQPLISGLSAHVDGAWAANRTAKQPIEKILLQCARRRNGEYEPEALERLRKQGHTDPIYMMITDIKCRAAIAWIKDVSIPAGEIPAHFEPTPVPELPPEVVQLAKIRATKALHQRMTEMSVSAQDLAQDKEQIEEIMTQVRDEMQAMVDERARDDAERMTREVNDEMTEGNWYQVMDNFIDDFVTYPTAFIEGPVYKRKRKLVWKTGPNGKSIPQIEGKVVKEYNWISPFDMYPSSGARTLNDGNLIIHKRMSPRNLQEMIGVEGFDEEAIRLVLDLYAVGGLREWLSVDSARDYLEDRHNEIGDGEPKIDVLKFFGDVPGKLLIEWGMDESQIPDPLMAYPAIIWKIGNYIISARLNDHPLAKRNIYSASFIKKNGSIWGRGIPQVLKDIQRICNSAAIALQRNMGIASGPMAWAIEDKLTPGTDLTMFPWKVFRFTSDQVGGDGKRNLPMGFFQPRVIVRELLEIYQKFYDQASEITGIPAYVYGSEKIGGAGETASGLSMLMNAAAKGLRASVIHIDQGVTKPSWEEHWLQIVLTEPERAIGDVKIIARASDYLMQIEQLQSALYDALQLTGNPIDMEIIGLEGRAEMLREYMKRLKMPVHKIIPDRDALVNRSANQQFQSLVTNLSKAMGVEPQKLIEMAQGGQVQEAA